MTTPPEVGHDDQATTRTASRGYGWGPRADRRRHAGIGTREEMERHAEEAERHGTAAWGESGTAAERHSSGTAERNGTPERHGRAARRHASGTARGTAARHAGTAQRHSGTDERHDSGTPERHDDRADADEAERHEFIVPLDGRADDRASDDEDTVPRHRLIDDLRFVNEPVASLRDLLRFAREASYNMSHIPLVRAANIAFFWLFTTPILVTVLFLLWAFVVRLHRALTAAAITLVIAPAAHAIPAIGWLVPEWMVVTTWSTTAWSVAGGALLVFAVGTAVALAGERRR